MSSQTPEPADPLVRLWGLGRRRFIGLRRLFNYWRLRAHVEDGVRIEYYPSRRGGIVVTRVGPWSR